MENIENVPLKLEETICLCGTCKSCLAAIERANAITFKMEGRSKLRLAERFTEEILKRAVMDAQNHLLITETCPNQTLDYYLIYHEVSLSIIHEATRTRVITARKNLANDPKTIAEFKAALLARREAAGKKEKKAKTNGEKAEKVVTQAAKYKTDDPQEKAIITALFQANKSGILAMCIDMIATSNPGYDVKGIAKKMGVKI